MNKRPLSQVATAIGEVDAEEDGRESRTFTQPSTIEDVRFVNCFFKWCDLPVDMEIFALCNESYGVKFTIEDMKGYEHIVFDERIGGDIDFDVSFYKMLDEVIARPDLDFRPELVEGIEHRIVHGIMEAA